MILTSSLKYRVDSMMNEEYVEVLNKKEIIDHSGFLIFFNFLITLFLLRVCLKLGQDFSLLSYFTNVFSVIISFILAGKIVRKKFLSVELYWNEVNDLYNHITPFYDLEEVTNEVYNEIIADFQILFDKNRKDKILKSNFMFYLIHLFIIGVGIALFVNMQGDAGLNAIVALAFSYSASRTFNFYKYIRNL